MLRKFFLLVWLTPALSSVPAFAQGPLVPVRTLVECSREATELAKLGAVLGQSAKLVAVWAPVLETGKTATTQLELLGAFTYDAEIQGVVAATFRNAASSTKLSATTRESLDRLGELEWSSFVPEGTDFSRYAGTGLSMLAGRSLSQTESAEAWTRLRLAESVMGRPLTPAEAGIVLRAHDIGTVPYTLADLAGKRRLLGAVFTPEQSNDFIRLGITGTSKRSFEAAESPEEARRIVASIQKSDAFPSITPPGVFAAKTGSGEFGAIAPVGLANARLSVKPNGRGGSTITETFTSTSPFPFGSKIIDTVHGAFTDPERAYKAARERRGR